MLSQPSLKPQDKIIVALDTPTLPEALQLAKALAPYVGCFKVGLELLSAEGAPRVVEALHGVGGKVFFDGKFCDIPNTVAKASRAVAQWGVHLFNVHACCGEKSLAAAAKEKKQSLLLAVTVLTSIQNEESVALFGKPAKVKVADFIEMAARAGCDGVVCSPEELDLFQGKDSWSSLLRVTPGVRPEWAEANDQARILTPSQAVQRGATHLVIGRPITSPPKAVGSPVDAAKRILSEIEGVRAQ